MDHPDPRDELAIQRLVFDYAAGNDDRDIDAIMACFTPEGSFGLQVAGQDPVGPIEGAEAVAAFYGETLGAQDDQRRHVITNVRLLECDGRTARATSYFSLMVTDDSGTRVATTGVYADTLVRGEDGWRFATKWLDLAGMF